MPCCSLIHWGSSKEACTFQASSWWHPHQGSWLALAISQAYCAPLLTRSPIFHNLLLGVLGEDLFLSSSSKPPAGSWRKLSTSGPNCSSGSRLKSRRGGSASLSSPDPGPHWGRLYLKKGAGLSSSQMLQCLLFCPQDLLQQS